MEQKGLFYFVLMTVLAVLCILGIVTFFKNLHNNYLWRWIYIFGGVYLLFDIFAIAAGWSFWHRLILKMFDVNAAYWNILWTSFILMGFAVFVLGIVLLKQRSKGDIYCDE